jgi:hypothetical protein
VVRMARNVLGMVKHASQGTICDYRDPFKTIKTPVNGFGSRR